MEQEKLLEFGYETKDKKLLTYYCGYYSYKFKQWVGTIGKGREAGSSQVKCPKCGNMLKTFG